MSCDDGIGAVYGPAMISPAVVHPDKIDAVVFDMGGVFVVPSPQAVSAIVTAAGVALELDDESARLGHYAGVAAITSSLSTEPASEADPRVWEAYDMAYFAAAGLSGEGLQTAVVARHSERVSGDSAAIWRHVLEENRDAFHAISGLRPVAVVTNNNGTAIEQCRELGLCQVGPGALPSVAAIVDSGVLGIAKPDPRIFAPALEALGTSATRTLYVGDTVHADVHGAEAAGMPVVQIDPFDYHADHSHWRLPDVVALAEHLA
jgi:putative hydrolase of the HAD superfamily